MKRRMKRKGFTLVEVILFLAVTALLFVGIIAGTGATIENQRFFDTTQNFAEFLRGVYSDVANPRGFGTGDSDQAMYGRMITFGEAVNQNGDDVKSDDYPIFIYNVRGMATVDGSGTVEEMLRRAGVNVLEEVSDPDTGTEKVKASVAEDPYHLKWDASLEEMNYLGMDARANGVKNNELKKTIMIVRHPRTGTINTIVYNDTIQVNKTVKDANTAASYNYNKNPASLTVVGFEEFLTQYLGGSGSPGSPAVSSDFEVEEVNFCINSGGWMDGNADRWNVRLVANARNTSGVEVIDRDVYDSGEWDTVNGRWKNTYTANKCRRE